MLSRPRNCPAAGLVARQDHPRLRRGVGTDAPRTRDFRFPPTELNITRLQSRLWLLEVVMRHMVDFLHLYDYFLKDFLPFILIFVRIEVISSIELSLKISLKPYYFNVVIFQRIVSY